MAWFTSRANPCRELGTILDSNSTCIAEMGRVPSAEETEADLLDLLAYLDSDHLVL